MSRFKHRPAPPRRQAEPTTWRTVGLASLTAFAVLVLGNWHFFLPLIGSVVGVVLVIVFVALLLNVR